jgi:hypothetical protein
VVSYDSERRCWVGRDPRLGEQIVVAESKEKAEHDLALLIAALTLGSPCG